MSDFARIQNARQTLTELQSYLATITPTTQPSPITTQQSTHAMLQSYFSHLRQELIPLVSRLYESHASQTLSSKPSATLQSLITSLHYNLSQEPDQSIQFINTGILSPTQSTPPSPPMEHSLPLNYRELLQQQMVFIDPSIEHFHTLLYKLQHLRTTIDTERNRYNLQEMLQNLDITDTSDDAIQHVDEFYNENNEFKLIFDYYSQKYPVQRIEYCNIQKLIIYELYLRKEAYELANFVQTIITSLRLIVQEHELRETKISKKIIQFQESIQTLYQFISEQTLPKSLTISDENLYKINSITNYLQQDINDTTTTTTTTQSNTMGDIINDTSSSPISPIEKNNDFNDDSIVFKNDTTSSQSSQTIAIQNYFRSILDPTTSLSTLSVQQLLLNLLASTKSTQLTLNTDKIDTSLDIPKSPTSSTTTLNDDKSPLIKENDINDIDDDSTIHKRSKLLNDTNLATISPVNAPPEQMYSISLPLPINLNALPTPLYRLAMLFVSLQRLSWSSMNIHVVNTREYILSPTSTISTSTLFNPKQHLQNNNKNNFNNLSTSIMNQNDSDNVLQNSTTQEQTGYISSLFINTTSLDAISVALDQYSLLITIPTMIVTNKNNDDETTTPTTTDGMTQTPFKQDKSTKVKKYKKMASIDDSSSLHFLFSYIPSFATAVLFGYTSYSHIYPSDLTPAHLPMTSITKSTNSTMTNTTKLDQIDSEKGIDELNNNDTNPITPTTNINIDSNTKNKNNTQTIISTIDDETTTNTESIDLFDMYRINYGIDISPSNPLHSIILTHGYPWLQRLCGLNNGGNNIDRYVLTTDLISTQDYNNNNNNNNTNSNNDISKTNPIRLTTLSVLQRLVTQSLSTFWLQYEISSLYHGSNNTITAQSLLSNNPQFKSHGWLLPSTQQSYVMPFNNNITSSINTTLSSTPSSTITSPLSTTTTTSSPSSSTTTTTTTSTPSFSLNQQQQLFATFCQNKLNQATTTDTSQYDPNSLIIHAGLQPYSHTITTANTYLNYVQASLQLFFSQLTKKVHSKMILKSIIPHTIDTFFNTIQSYLSNQTPSTIPTPSTTIPSTIDSTDAQSKSTLTTNIHYSQQPYIECIINFQGASKDRTAANTFFRIFIALPTYPFTISTSKTSSISIAIFSVQHTNYLSGKINNNNNNNEYQHLESIEQQLCQSLYEIYAIPINTIINSNQQQSLNQDESTTTISTFRPTPLGTLMACASHTFNPIHAILALFNEVYWQNNSSSLSSSTTTTPTTNLSSTTKLTTSASTSMTDSNE